MRKKEAYDEIVKKISTSQKIEIMMFLYQKVVNENLCIF